MRRCQLVHDLRLCPVAVGSPQTQTQRDQVRGVGNIDTARPYTSIAIATHLAGEKTEGRNCSRADVMHFIFPTCHLYYTPLYIVNIADLILYRYKAFSKSHCIHQSH